MREQDKWVSVIHNLIETCHDGQEGYRLAAEQAEDPELRAFLSDQSQERGLFAQELEDRASHSGAHGAKPGTSTGGALHRAWIGLKKSLGGGDDAILSSVETGDDSARSAYEKALQEVLPEAFQQTLRKHLESITVAQDYVRLMRARRNAA